MVGTSSSRSATARWAPVWPTRPAFLSSGSPNLPGLDRPTWLGDVVRDARAEVIVLDARDVLTLAEVRRVRDRTHARIVVIDDLSEVRLAADDVFYPPVPQASALTWPDFAGRVYMGWEWVLLRPEFAAEPRRGRHEPPAVLVAMGGSDPAGLTLDAIRALGRIGRPIRIVLLIGPGFGRDAELVPLLASCPHETLVVRAGDVRARMLEADLGVLSFGVTAYEAAACALPAIHLCLTEDHARSSSAFAGAGIAISLGRAAEVDETRLAEVVEATLADATSREAIGARARRLVDGAGAARIAEVIEGRRFG